MELVARDKMACKIYKYPLRWPSEQTVSMPVGAQILCAQMQMGVICLWAIVNPGTPTEDRNIRVYGTGIEVDLEGHSYIGTVQSGPLVWHVFEVQ